MAVAPAGSAGTSTTPPTTLSGASMAAGSVTTGPAEPSGGSTFGTRLLRAPIRAGPVSPPVTVPLATEMAVFTDRASPSELDAVGPPLPPVAIPLAGPELPEVATMATVPPLIVSSAPPATTTTLVDPVEPDATFAAAAPPPPDVAVDSGLAVAFPAFPVVAEVTDPVALELPEAAVVDRPSGADRENRPPAPAELQEAKGR